MGKAWTTRKSWRSQDEHDVREYKAVTAYERDSRLEIGMENWGTGTPGSQFNGDPVQHLTEEMYDGMYYLFFVQRKIEAQARLLHEAAFIIDNLRGGENMDAAITDWIREIHEILA